MTGRDRVRRTPAAIALGAGIVVAAGCSGATSDDEARERLAEALVAETGGALDDDTAACVADALHAEFGADSFRRVRDARRAAPGDTGADEVRVRVVDVFARCEALGSIIDQGG